MVHVKGLKKLPPDAAKWTVAPPIAGAAAGRRRRRPRPDRLGAHLRARADRRHQALLRRARPAEGSRSRVSRRVPNILRRSGSRFERFGGSTGSTGAGSRVREVRRFVDPDRRHRVGQRARGPVASEPADPSKPANLRTSTCRTRRTFERAPVEPSNLSNLRTYPFFNPLPSHQPKISTITPGMIAPQMPLRPALASTAGPMWLTSARSSVAQTNADGEVEGAEAQRRAPWRRRRRRRWRCAGRGRSGSPAPSTPGGGARGRR